MKNIKHLTFILAILLIAIAAILLCRTDKAAITKLKDLPSIISGRSSGYLEPSLLPNSLSLIPAPPAPDSTAFALDEEYARKALTLRGTAVWDLAASDAILEFPHAAETFDCALNAPINEEQTPHLYMLLKRTLTDAIESTVPAKNHYKRPRPFLKNQQPICSPQDQERLAKQGSYPSAHTTIGMTWALILAQIAPEQSDAILARGQAFSLNRLICNVHWYSDIIQGRFMAAFDVAKLQADPTFQADLEAAKEELAAVRAKGLRPSRDCAKEAAALSMHDIFNR